MPEWLRQRALISPHRLALVFGGERWTFADLDRRASAAATHLRAAGVRPRDRVALLAGNGPGFVQMVHAAPRLGAALVPLNTRLTAPELVALAQDCEPALLVHDEANSDTAAGISAEVAGLPHVHIAELAAKAEAMSSQETDDCDGMLDLSTVHTIIYTSGTSGRAKGAMLTFGNHWWSAIGSALNLGLRDDDRWLACMPLYHVGGLAVLLRSVIYGIPVILHESFDAGTVSRAIDEDGVTIASLVPTMLARLLEARRRRPLPHSLRCLLVGGGPLPMSLLEECVRHGWPVAATYGLTEAASQVATLSPEDAPRRPGSAGKALFCTQVRIEIDDGEAPPGVPGEILVRGSTVTLGYLRRPRDSAEALRGGWLHTGDIGYLDAEGHLYVLDRRDDLIVSGGENVYPAEVEEALRSHPYVLDAGVIGLPDEVWGQRVVAVVVLRETARITQEALLSFSRERLAAYKLPKELRFVASLPRNPAGKLLRRELRQEWSRNQARST